MRFGKLGDLGGLCDKLMQRKRSQDVGAGRRIFKETTPNSPKAQRLPEMLKRMTIAASSP